MRIWIFLLTPLAFVLAASSAEAAPPRIWISAAKGVDTAGCGPAITPCRTLQYGVTNVAPGGEVDFLDPGGYGSATITQSVNIVNDGVGPTGAQAVSGDVITIAAAEADQVTIRGVTITGVGTAASGINITKVGRLNLFDTTISGFTSAGVNVVENNSTQGTLINIYDSRIVNGSGVGILATANSKGVFGVLKSVEMVNVAQGVKVNVGNIASGAGAVIFAISSSQLTNIPGTLIDFSGGSSFTAVTLQDTLLLGGGAGTVINLNGSNIQLNMAHVTLPACFTGVTVAGGAGVHSAGDNIINCGTPISGGTFQPLPKY